MKRDIDILRAIVLKLRDLDPEQNIELTPENFGSSHDAATLVAHTRLLLDEAYIEGEISDTISAPPCAFIDRLTWKGHDFADMLENETRWNEFKHTVLKPGMGLSVAFTFELFKRWITKSFGLS